ncbi:MAG: alpha/beta hydrolase [Ilumatobacter sp.]|nr:alpha/beta hydrolase [Ilumatobacter sp.]
MTAPPTRRVRTSEDFGGIELDVVDAGRHGDPVIVLAHGWPESSHSWRHQIEPLVDAGYRVLVPDQRGYAGSSAPREVAAYRSDHLAADLCALLDDVDADTAIFVGHDWGSLVVWDLARFRPERVSAIVNVSVPYTPWPIRPTDLFRSVYADRFFYMLYFQLPDRPEQELEADVETTLRTILWTGSAEMAGPPPDPSKLPSLEHGTVLGTFAHGKVVPTDLPTWLTRADLDRYVDQFTTSGFFGPTGWYRNIDADWELTRDLPAPAMPCAFIGGDKDGVIAHRMEYVDRMRDSLPDFRGVELIADAGHWTQQERPAEFNAALLRLLAQL